MSETGIYALGTFGTEAGRVAAIARHIPDAVVYIRGRPNMRNLFAHHGVETVDPKIPTNCPGCGRAEMQRWIAARSPDRLIMEMKPYGVFYDELVPYIRARRSNAFYLQRRGEPGPDFQPRDFRGILKTDAMAGPGEELYPLLCFEPHELPSHDESRTMLGATGRPVVLIIGEGTTPRYDKLVIDLCNKRGLDHVVVNTWPVMPYMVGADLIVGYAGYSQIEAEAVDVPMHAIPNYADPSQHWRVNTTRQDLEHAIATLEVRPSGPRARAGYVNRARRAAAYVTGDPGWRTVDG